MGDPGELAIPIGPTGVLVGAALRDDSHAPIPIQRDDMIMWALTDPQRATRVVMDTSDFYVRQLLLRAAAVGERIAIYSNSPQRWMRCRSPTSPWSSAAGHRSSCRRSSSTTARSPRRRRACPRRWLRWARPIAARTRHPVRAELPHDGADHLGGSYDLDVAIVAFRQEQAWTG